MNNEREHKYICNIGTRLIGTNTQKLLKGIGAGAGAGTERERERNGNGSGIGNGNGSRNGIGIRDGMGMGAREKELQHEKERRIAHGWRQCSAVSGKRMTVGTERRKDDS